MQGLDRPQQYLKFFEVNIIRFLLGAIIRTAFLQHHYLICPVINVDKGDETGFANVELDLTKNGMKFHVVLLMSQTSPNFYYFQAINS